VNFTLIGELIRLRYKLMWAKTRTRSGKIALFFAGYLLLVMFLVIMGAGGFGAGAIAVKSGKGTLVASAVLGGLFVQALLATVILGFGVNEVFVDEELRRYPLHAREREFARHFLGILDPFWILIVVLDFGLMAGLYLFGAGSFWLGLIAVVLLVICNYLIARVLSMLIGRLVRKKGGSTVLMALIMGFAFLPGLIANESKGKSHQAPAWLHLLTYTPPAGAGVAMTHADASAFSGLGVVLLWMAGSMAVLVALERRPAQSKVSHTAKVTWDSPFERIGGIFGPEYAVLVGQWLRFWSRNARFRMIYPLALPIVAGIMAIYSKQGAFGKADDKFFVGALGGFACAGFLGTAQFAVNQFGYVGGGFRRYLLLPMDPAAVLRAGSFTFVLLSSVLIPVATIAWLIFAPVKTDARMLVMLVSSSVMGLFLMAGIGLWVAVLGPKRGNYYHTFGNDLSFAANVAVIGGMFGLLFLPRLVSKVWPGAVTPAYWWVEVVLACAAFAFYRLSLGAMSRAFRARREQLLAVMDGKA
jgi:hypothetical protein